MLSEAAQRVFFFVARAAMLTSHATALHDVVRNRGTNMQGKIALEEHFAIEPTLGDSQLFGSHVWKDLSHRLLDIRDAAGRNGQARDRIDDPVAQCPAVKRSLT
jgi:hypothetical protein